MYECVCFSAAWVEDSVCLCALTSQFLMIKPPSVTSLKCVVFGLNARFNLPLLRSRSMGEHVCSFAKSHMRRLMLLSYLCVRYEPAADYLI